MYYLYILATQTHTQNAKLESPRRKERVIIIFYKRVKDASPKGWLAANERIDFFLFFFLLC